MGYHFEDEAWKEYHNLEKLDKKKVDALLKEIRRGNQIAHAEELKYELSGYKSVHINGKDRLIYKFDGTTVFILSCTGHYKDS